MTAYEELLHSVTSDPEDDRARLAFAAHIRASEPERARFIELQVEWARECRARGDRARVQGISVHSEWQALLKRHEAEWVRPLAKYATNWTFDRGFVVGISIDPEIFLEYGEWLFVNAPIRVVEFFTAEGSFPTDELAASPLLQHLDAIALPRNHITGHDVERLAKSPNLTRLLHLVSFQYQKPLGANAYDALASSPLTRKLLRVRFDDRDFPGERYEDTGEVDFHGAPVYGWTEPTPDGVALEAKYGYIPWLHRRDNGVDAYDAAYFVSQGILPVRPPGSR